MSLVPPPLFSNFDQIGVVVNNIDESVYKYEKIFGSHKFEIIYGEPVRILDDGTEQIIKAKAAFAQIGDIEYELIEIIEGNSIHADFLQQHGEGLHHLGMYVPDIDIKINEFKNIGINILQLGRGRMRYVYMDTQPVILEFIERNP